MTQDLERILKKVLDKFTAGTVFLSGFHVARNNKNWLLNKVEEDRTG